MEKLTQRVKELALCYGATAVGIVTREMLADGPQSADISYVLPRARSAVSFCVPLDQKNIDDWFSKKNQTRHFRDNIQKNVIAGGISLELSNYIKHKGFSTVPLTANTAYRSDTKKGYLDEKPPVSHRYLAVRSGVGFFGLSGNVLTRQEGAAVILGSVVTEAELIPTEPIAAAENYCDDCRLCEASCASGYINGKERVSVSLGGVDFSYTRKRHHSRCDYVCGGFAGLHKSGKWSTWSPARFPIPEEDAAFYPALLNAVGPFLKRPKPDISVFNVLMPGDKVELTCGNCQLICHPDKDVRKARYKLLSRSGVMVQHPDGKREAVSPEDAQAHLAGMRDEERALFE
ncbi:MAG: epoxyqueuosine reductase [Deltaproteobacteria bacterium]|nr:epoxyqueuosine reductase [Deltaproteobacteria bacterium]